MTQNGRASRTFVLALPAVLALACGGSPEAPAATPTAPTTPVAPPTQTWAVAGQVIDGMTGTPIPGAALTLDARPPVQADGDGRWRLEGTGTAPARLAARVQAAGFISRETFVMSPAPGRQDVALDLFPDRAPFSLTFYRQLVRNGHEAPGALQPLRRWTSNPSRDRPGGAVAARGGAAANGRPLRRGGDRDRADAA